MRKILAVEDSEDIGALLRQALGGYFVEQVHTLSEARAALKKIDFDLILIDVTLPDGNGFDLCLDLNRDLRHENIPKVMLTAKVEPADKVYGFNCGASDYITKPFNFLELKARIDRLLVRKPESSEGDLIHSCFAFNLNFQRCYWIDSDSKRQDLRLTPTEFRLFLTLVKSEGQALSRSFLERAAWEAHGAVIQARGIDTHIAHLRKKLGSLGSMIVSVYGHGYAFQSQKPESLAA